MIMQVSGVPVEKLLLHILCIFSGHFFFKSEAYMNKNVIFLYYKDVFIFFFAVLSYSMAKYCYISIITIFHHVQNFKFKMEY